ncbi:hypothetical protein ACL02S_16675 [Nocardia sp. 004]|uniref:LppU/SCO3897 family protein n=1 Tax=Nocardia sp. 004 TaxID=3385978 RepID=UPI0039A25F25
MGIFMHDQQDSDAVEPVVPQPDPGPMVSADVAGSRRGNRLVWSALVAVIVLAVAAGVTGYVLTRSEPVALAVEDCVGIDTGVPVEYGCTDNNALYRIVAREAALRPLYSACMKYPDVTKAVAEPVEADVSPEVVLCLAPTHFNAMDPGAVQVGDCITVEDAGETVIRLPCGSSSSVTKVIATELHTQVPVIDQACRAHPQAREAFAHASLGGRAIVLCTVSINPYSLDSAVVGDCTDKNLRTLVPCDRSDAYLRVLTVRTLYQKPIRPQCLDVFGANAFSMQHNDKTDLVLAFCLGPADESHARYARAGDCLLDRGAGESARLKLIDCADPAADYRVIELHEPDDGMCPSGISARITYDPGVTNGWTVCLGRN